MNEELKKDILEEFEWEKSRVDKEQTEIWLKEPNNPYFLHPLLIVYIAKKDLKKALEYCDKILKMNNPNKLEMSDAIHFKFRLLICLDKPKEAIEFIKKEIQKGHVDKTFKKYIDLTLEVLKI